MRLSFPDFRSRAVVFPAGCVGLLSLVFGVAASAQSPANAPPHPRVITAAQSTQTTPASREVITEEELRQRFVNQTFFLRGAYLDNSLHFDENGKLVSNSAQTSYTLSLVEFNKIHLGKHRLELEGVRYGLHFMGGSPSTESISAADKVRLTPRKNAFRIDIDRAVVVKPRQEKSSKDKANGKADGNQGVTRAMSAEHANYLLSSALNDILALGMDERLLGSLPDYWRFYYQGVSGKSGYLPHDASVLKQTEVDQKAKLVSAVEPASNEYAQKNNVAGVALYYVVVSPQGKAAEVAVGRPIGLGLDENAVASIRKASFQPAMKEGKPVPVMLALLVQFRIYSKRTAAGSESGTTEVDTSQPAASSLPGPYSIEKP